MDKLSRKQENFELALATLERFLAEPNRTEAARAGIIQGFEICFEQCWRLFAALAEANGTSAPFPRLALGAALKLQLIDDEELWLSMLEDRNLSTHTYREPMAARLLARIEARYLTALQTVRKQLSRES